MHRSRLFQELGLIILSLSAIVGCSGGPAASGADVQSFELTQRHPRYGIEAHYASDYAETRDGRVAVRVPEVFELANIAFAITDYGIENPYRVFKDSDYYDDVIDHFGPHRDHPLIDEIEFSDSRIGDYFEWRTSSLAYHFEGPRIVSGPQAGGLPYGATTDASGWFHDQRRLLEDFAKVTGFREFYTEHSPFYEEQIASYRAKVPVERMWEWLETQFPARYDAYSVVFSPLINASHNTIRFEHKGFRECVMVVGGPDLLADRTNDARVEEAALSRHVFTEIDHNYVNPVSARYSTRIGEALSDLDSWNEQDGYASAFATFNEYVTWAAFIIYAGDYYEDEVLAPVRAHEIRSMEEGRGFSRFGAFVAWLEERWDSAGSGTTLAELYPDMIEWFARN